jgi:hypothetical protein
MASKFSLLEMGDAEWVGGGVLIGDLVPSLARIETVVVKGVFGLK